MDAFLRDMLDSLCAIELVRARRRHAQRRGLECDVLEDRQLLASPAGGWASIAHVSHLHGEVAASGSHSNFEHMGGRGLVRNQTGSGRIRAPLPFSPPQTLGNAGVQASGTTNSQALTMPNPPAVNLAQLTASNPQLAADLQKLRTDTQAILAKSQVTPAETTALHDDLRAIDKAATTPPSQAAVQALQTDVKSFQGALPTDEEKAQLATDFTALVESRGVTDQTLIGKTISDAEAIVASSNVTSTDLATLVADRKAIQTDMGSTTTSSSMSGPLRGIDEFMGLGGLLGGQMHGMAGPMGIGARFGGPRGSAGWIAASTGSGQSSGAASTAAHGAKAGLLGGGPFGRWMI